MNRAILFWGSNPNQFMFIPTIGIQLFEHETVIAFSIATFSIGISILKIQDNDQD